MANSVATHFSSFFCVFERRKKLFVKFLPIRCRKYLDKSAT